MEVERRSPSRGKFGDPRYADMGATTKALVSQRILSLPNVFGGCFGLERRRGSFTTRGTLTDSWRTRLGACISWRSCSG